MSLPRKGNTVQRISIIFFIRLFFYLVQDCYGFQSEEQFHNAVSANLSRTQRDVKSLIRIGILLTNSDRSMEEIFRRAINEANTVFTHSTTLFNYQFEPNVQIVQDDDLLDANRKTCMLLEEGIYTLFGPRCSRLSNSLVSMANKYGVPYVETHWSILPNRKSYTISLHPDTETYGEGLHEYLTKTEKWSTMTVIHSQHDSLLKFSTLINKFGKFINIKLWDDSLDGARKLMKELKMHNGKNFLIDIPVSQVENFLILAYAHNMTGPDCTYVFTDWDVGLLNLSIFRALGQIKTFTIVLDQILNSKQTYRNRQDVYSSHANDVISHITNYGIIRDSLFLLAHGIQTVAKTRPLLAQKIVCRKETQLWPLGLSLINAVKSVPSKIIHGYTGPFRFNRYGLRTLFNLTVLSLNSTGFTPTSFWNVDNGLHAVQIPENKPEEYHKGIVLRVTTKHDEPFMFPIKRDVYGKPLTKPEAWDGYCVDMLNHIAKELNFNYTIHENPERQYGSLQDPVNGSVTYNGIMGELANNQADMAVAGFTITYEREQVVDFSTPWMTVGSSIIFTKPKSQKPSLFSFMQPLAPQVWLYVITIYLAVILCMFVTARLSPHEWRAPHHCDQKADLRKNQFTLLNSVYYYISALLNQGTELAPQATSTRLLTGVWWFFGLIIIATYTANLAAFLTVENTKSPIESVDDLVNQDVIHYGTLNSGSSYDTFTQSNFPIFKKIGDFMIAHPSATSNDTKEAIERVKKGNYAFILESSWNEYYVRRNCDLMQVGDLLDTKGYGIGFPPKSPWKDKVSETILKLQSAQILDDLQRKWFFEYKVTEPCVAGKDSSKSPNPLGIEQVGGVFIMLIVGFVVGFVVAIIEFLLATRDLDRRTVLRDMWRELKFATRCITTSKRLKSEVHKLSRSQSNIKLTASISNNMVLLDSTTFRGNTAVYHPGHSINMESQEPLINTSFQNTHNAPTTDTTPVFHISSMDRSDDQSIDKFGSKTDVYPNEVDYSWPPELEYKAPPSQQIPSKWTGSPVNHAIQNSQVIW